MLIVNLFFVIRTRDPMAGRHEDPEGSGQTAG